MGQIISEGLEYIGRIDNNGYVYDQSGNRMSKISDSGYIGEIGGGEIYGKIDEDGTIRDASGSVVGRIQADGYVYIHSKRVCKVSSEFIEKITPGAWNAGDVSSYSGRKTTSADVHFDPSDSFFFSPFFIKVVIGVILGIVMIVNGAGGIEMLVAGPICVFLFTFIFKIFNP